MNPITHIYGLLDPRDGTLRYVGKTERTLNTRLTAHIGTARSGKITHTAIWIRGLLNKNLRPQIILLEDVPSEDWAEAERFWIGYMRMLGGKLTNHCDGGPGVPRPDQELRERKSHARRGRQHTLEARQRMSEIARNRPPMSEAQRKKISESNRKRGKHSPESVAKRVAKMIGRKHSASTLEKISGRFIVTAPDGIEHEVVNLRAFCRTHGLHSSTMSAIANPDAPVKRHQYKGWRCRRA